MRIISFFFIFASCVFLIASAWEPEMRFFAVMTGIFAIYHKIDA